MAAACIGSYFGVAIDDIASALREYAPNNNRSELVETGKNKLILDAYNANPSSMSVALSNFAEMDHEPKLALIGHMLELGEDSDEEHQQLINLLEQLNLPSVLVGKNFEGCNKKGFQYFETPISFLEWLQDQTIEDHLIIAKGSRMVAMERVKVLL